MTEPAPEYTPEQVEHAYDNAILLVRVLKTEIHQLRRNEAERERIVSAYRKDHDRLLGKLKACQKERDDYQAVSVRLVGELQDCEVANARLLAQSRIKETPGYQAGWRQHERRRL